jgi:hypothetical protein
MNEFSNWISNNKSWLFEGVGVALLIGLVNFFWKKKKINDSNSTNSNNSIKGGDNNIQAGRDVTFINESKKKDQ